MAKSLQLPFKLKKQLQEECRKLAVLYAQHDEQVKIHKKSKGAVVMGFVFIAVALFLHREQPGVAAYIGVKDRLHAATAKGAVSAMTRSLAQEVAGTGITVNCVVPGVIDTVRGASAGQLPPGVDGDSNLIGRKGKPEEVAALVRALCGLAGRYVTGQVIHCNGGMYLGA